MSDYGGGLNYYVEGFIALFIMLMFLLTAMMTLRKRHRDTAAWHVNLGAAIYGALFGTVVGFIIVPLRMVFVNGAVDPQTAAYSGFGFLAIMIALRRGMLARLPFLGPQVKAYRRASLRRAIEIAQQQLDQLTPQAA
ncbi:MAG: hypothetical protein VX640_12870 [Pseudomonadota bacterium]|nr:hypothetical protein [Pseudomonadota bacterium]